MITTVVAAPLRPRYPELVLLLVADTAGAYAVGAATRALFTSSKVLPSQLARPSSLKKKA
eukprot:7678-Heterococcus_DN1.PRE.2